MIPGIFEFHLKKAFAELDEAGRRALQEAFRAAGAAPADAAEAKPAGEPVRPPAPGD